MLEFIQANESLLWWLVVVSAVSLVLTVVLVPVLIVRIPEDYFVHRKRTPVTGRRHPVLALIIRIVKNLLGVIFVLAGVAMLVLPGQGVLSILAGLFLLEFPGKYRAERWLVRRRAVFKSINWLRRKLDAPTLIEPPAAAGD